MTKEHHKRQLQKKDINEKYQIKSEIDLCKTQDPFTKINFIKWAISKN